MPDISIVIVTRNQVAVFIKRLNILLQGLEAMADANARKGWMEAFKGIPEIWAQRRVVPPGIEEQIRLLD